MLVAPILSQPPRGGGGEDGLAEAFELGREAVEAVAAGIHPRQHAVEFVGDAFLFGERGKCYFKRINIGATDSWNGCRFVQLFQRQ